MGTFEEIKRGGWAFKLAHYYPPATFDDRIGALVVPLLSRLGRHPDLISFGSNFWDVAVMVMDDLASGMPADPLAKTLPPLDAPRLALFRQRLDHALDLLQTTFPTSRIAWRTASEPRCEPDVVHCTRSAQLAQVADHAVSLRPDLAVDYYGANLRGYNLFLSDRKVRSFGLADAWTG